MSLSQAWGDDSQSVLTALHCDFNLMAENPYSFSVAMWTDTVDCRFCILGPVTVMVQSSVKRVQVFTNLSSVL